MFFFDILDFHLILHQIVIFIVGSESSDVTYTQKGIFFFYKRKDQF